MIDREGHAGPIEHAYIRLVSLHEEMLEMGPDNPSRGQITAVLRDHVSECGFDQEAQVQAIQDAANNTHKREEETRA